MQRFIATGLLAVCASAVKINQATAAPATAAVDWFNPTPAQTGKLIADTISIHAGIFDPKGVITKEMVMQAVPSLPATEWALIDPKGDGADATEVLAWAMTIANDAGATDVFFEFGALDKDGDWQLTAEELAGSPFAGKLPMADTDKNGKVDFNEALAFYANNKAAIAAYMPPAAATAPVAAAAVAATVAA